MKQYVRSLPRDDAGQVKWTPLAKASGLTAYALAGASGAPQAELEAIARGLGLDPLLHRRWTEAEAERILSAWHARRGERLEKYPGRPRQGG